MPRPAEDGSLPVHRQVRRGQLPLPAMRPRWWLQAAAGRCGAWTSTALCGWNAARRSAAGGIGRQRSPAAQGSACASWCSASGTGAAVVTGDEVDRYLRGRGLTHRHLAGAAGSTVARLLRRVRTANRGRSLAEYPAMLALHPGAGWSRGDACGPTCATAKSSTPPTPRRCSPPASRRRRTLVRYDAKSRCAKASDRAWRCTGDRKPVWAGISVGNLEKLWVPDTVRGQTSTRTTTLAAILLGQCFTCARAAFETGEDHGPACGCSCRAMRARTTDRCGVPDQRGQSASSSADRASATGWPSVGSGSWVWGAAGTAGAPRFQLDGRAHALRHRPAGAGEKVRCGLAMRPARSPSFPTGQTGDAKRQPWSPTARITPGRPVSPIRPSTQDGAAYGELLSSTPAGTRMPRRGPCASPLHTTRWRI